MQSCVCVCVRGCSVLPEEEAGRQSQIHFFYIVLLLQCSEELGVNEFYLALVALPLPSGCLLTERQRRERE